MHMLYNSENFAVMRFAGNARGGQGYEIVDKTSRREIYLDGLLADHFQAGVEYLISQTDDEARIDDFLSGYTTLAHHPVVLH
jgi:hypothetical protein